MKGTRWGAVRAKAATGNWCTETYAYRGDIDLGAIASSMGVGE